MKGGYIACTSSPFILSSLAPRKVACVLLKFDLAERGICCLLVLDARIQILRIHHGE